VNQPDPSKIRTFVLEDEWAARNYLVELLDSSRLAQTVGAVATADEARQALLGPSRLTVEAVFVDVRLAGGRDDGLAVVTELMQLEPSPLVVLATAFPDHAIQAYALGVADYLLKPFTEERVEQCLHRLRPRRDSVTTQTPVRLVARRDKSLVFFEPEQVWAFEAADRTTRVHTRAGVFDLDLSLAAIEASFGRSLVRVHRNWLVNTVHIKELERDGSETRLFVGEGILPDGRGIHIPVARDRAQRTREMLLENAAGLRR
jgi:two-component system, LytTR family, response regulator LytT